jgi:hypothetical protein
MAIPAACARSGQIRMGFPLTKDEQRSAQMFSDRKRKIGPPSSAGVYFIASAAKWMVAVQLQAPTSEASCSGFRKPGGAARLRFPA